MFPGFDELCFYLPKLSIGGDQQQQVWDAIIGSSFDYKNNHELLEFAILLQKVLAQEKNLVLAQKVLLFTLCVISSYRRQWNCSALVKRGPAQGKRLGDCPRGCSEMPRSCLLSLIHHSEWWMGTHWHEESLRASQGACQWGTVHPAY